MAASPTLWVAVARHCSVPADALGASVEDDGPKSTDELALTKAGIALAEDDVAPTKQGLLTTDASSAVADTNVAIAEAHLVQSSAMFCDNCSDLRDAEHSRRWQN
jgi:hypothetical protein